MSNSLNEQSPNAAEQIAQINDKLNQVQEILEAPEWSQEIYNKADDLTRQIRETFLAIFSNPTATAMQRQQAQHVLLKESNRLQCAADKRHRQYAVALQKQQRANEKRQRPDKDVLSLIKSYLSVCGKVSYYRTRRGLNSRAMIFFSRTT